jgi:hypothetical protein
LGDIHIERHTLLHALKNAFADDRLAVRRFTPHDTLSIAKGHMRNMGVSREISELALNHKMRGLDAIYDVRDSFPNAARHWKSGLISSQIAARQRVC